MSPRDPGENPSSEGETLPFPRDAVSAKEAEVPAPKGNRDETDETLAARSADGDRKAFAVLYDRYRDRLYAYAFRRVLDRAAAEDVLSTVFLKALERLRSFDPSRGAFSAWIYGIARNAVNDHFRAKAKTASLGRESEDGEFDAWDVPTEDSMTIDAEYRDSWERLAPKLVLLSREQREILVMRVWDDLSYAEIARVLGKREGACKMAFSRALAALRAAMAALMIAALLMALGAGGRT